MVNIIVQYSEEVPDESKLESTYKNVKTSRNSPTRAMTVPSSSVKDILNKKNVEQIRYNQEVTTSQTQQSKEKVKQPEQKTERETKKQEQNNQTNQNTQQAHDELQAESAQEQNDQQAVQQNPNYTTATEQNISQSSWNLEVIQANYAWAENITGAEVKVAVIDTGFHTDHPDLQFSGGSSIFSDDPWTNDHTGHGTHVAGVVNSVSPGTDIYGIKIYHEKDVTEEGHPTTDVFNLTEGVWEALKHNPNIIVISSGFQGGDAGLRQAIQSATDQGTLVVAASGNGKASVDHPAAYPEVVSVSSVNKNLNPAGDTISGSKNELAAPGVSITSQSSPQSLYGYPYATLSGSSQAAPHVAGVAALVMQKHGLSATKTRSYMQNQARDLGSPSLLGNGLVQYLSPEEKAPLQENEDQDQQPSEESTNEQNDGQDSIQYGDDQNNNESSQDTNANQNDKQSNHSQNENQNNNSNQSSEKSNSSEVREENVQENDSNDQSENLDNEESSKEKNSSKSEEIPTQSTVWVNPNADGSQSTLNFDAIKSVSDNGTLAISIDSSMLDVNELVLSSNQVNQIIERNISILITKKKMEWVIPSTNFNRGETTLRFPFGHLTIPKTEQALSSIYTFSMRQNGEEIIEFEDPMIFRFVSEENWTSDEQAIYVWSNGKWREYSSQFAKTGVQTFANHTGTFAVFSRSAFQENQENANEDESDPEQTNNSENKTNTSGDSQTTNSETDSNNIIYWIIGIIATITFIGLLMFFYIKRSK